jgi:carboxylate-amine ligase
VASGTSIVGDIVPPKFAEGARYARSIATYRALDNEQSTCACHIHVHLPDRERALSVSNHLRPWLPALVALTANSPFWVGHDTGYASWRTMAWARWPAAGPPPYFESLDHFDDLVGTLLATGVFMDRGTIYWDIRPSDHVPTLETRVADIGTSVNDSLLLAALVRALVMVADAEIEAGHAAPRISPELLRAAYWLSARDGLDGGAIDLTTGQLIAAGEQIEGLLAYARPGLAASGDLAVVTAGWRRVTKDGGGAARQRAAYARRGRLSDVVDYLIDETVPGTDAVTGS